MDDRVRRWLVARPSAFASADISSRSRRRVRDAAFASRARAPRPRVARPRARSFRPRRAANSGASRRRARVCGARRVPSGTPRRVRAADAARVVRLHPPPPRYIARPTNVARGYRSRTRLPHHAHPIDAPQVIKNLPRQAERARATRALHEHRRRRSPPQRPARRRREHDRHARPRSVANHHVRLDARDDRERPRARERRRRRARRPRLPHLSRAADRQHARLAACAAPRALERARSVGAPRVRARDDVRRDVQSARAFARRAGCAASPPCVRRCRARRAPARAGRGAPTCRTRASRRARSTARRWRARGARGANARRAWRGEHSARQNATRARARARCRGARRRARDARGDARVAGRRARARTARTAATRATQRAAGAWTVGDAARATLASACVSLASLVGCALMAIGARADALAWLSDAAIGAMLGDALGCQLPSALEAATRARGRGRRGRRGVRDDVAACWRFISWR